MLNENYISKLKLFLKKDILISEDKEKVIVKIDTEIKYILKKEQNKYVLLINERGKESIRSIYKNEMEMERKYAFLLKTIFSGGIVYEHTNEFENIIKEQDLKYLMKTFFDKKYYSINLNKKNCININKVEEKRYDIYYLDAINNKHIIESASEVPFVFERFYNEVVYFMFMLNIITEYEVIFGDKLSFTDKLSILGY